MTADAPAISEKAWTYGQEFPGHPDLRVYDILQPKSGRYIIDFEMRRYQIKCHLPEIEDEDSLYTAALYGAEEHPVGADDQCFHFFLFKVIELTGTS